MPSAKATPPKPNWNKWTQMQFVELWQAVALACDIEPGAIHLPSKGGMFRYRLRFEGDTCFYERLDIAVADRGTGFELHEPEDDEIADKRRWRVKLGEFGAWAVSLEWQPFPEEFPADEPGELQRWPWGHETKKLKALAAAVGKFYPNHNPERPNDNVPDNVEVEAFLKEKGMKPHMAKAIATIIRPDKAKKGRRQREGR